MPKVILPNDGVRDSVIRPIALGVCRQIQDWTGIRLDNVLFNGDTQVAVQPGSKIDEDPNFNKTPGQALWRMNVRDEHQMDKLLATAVLQMENPEIFYDEALGVFLRPAYSTTDVTLEFEYRATDHHAARRWRDEMRTKVSMNRSTRTHIINYSYLVPKDYFPLLEHIHTLREAQAGYGEDFETWLKNCFTQNATILTTNAGVHERWAVKEQQARVHGQFEFAELPDESRKDGELTTHTTMFTYKLVFDCPVAMACDYPLIVHNQLIKERYWCIPDKDDIKKYASRSPQSLTALGAFEVPYSTPLSIEAARRFPEFHEFYAVDKPTNTLEIFTALLGIEAPDPTEPDKNKTVMDFNSIDTDWEIHPQFLKHMRWDHKWLCIPGESMISVALYDGSALLDYGLYGVDSDLNLVLNFEPDLRKTYYVRLAILSDPSYLSPAASKRLSDSGDTTGFIGALLCPGLKDYPPKILSGNIIAYPELERYLTRIKRCRNTNATSTVSKYDVGLWVLVNTLMLSAHRAA